MNSLTDADLADIARIKGDNHLSALAERKHVHEQVTDVIVDRGSPNALRRLASNAGAKFSDAGISKMVTKAGEDEELASRIVGLRADLPPEVLEHLLWETTDQVRNRLLAGASTQLRQLIERTLALICIRRFREDRMQKISSACRRSSSRCARRSGRTSRRLLLTPSTAKCWN